MQIERVFITYAEFNKLWHISVFPHENQVNTYFSCYASSRQMLEMLAAFNASEVIVKIPNDKKRT